MFRHFSKLAVPSQYFGSNQVFKLDLTKSNCPGDSKLRLPPLKSKFFSSCMTTEVLDVRKSVAQFAQGFELFSVISSSTIEQKHIV